MKNHITVVLLLLCFSCKESGVQLGKPSTYVHYFNGGNNDFAQSILETSDKGFLILANSQVTGGNRIKLIKTDVYGNQVWQKLFPDPAGTNPNANYKGNGITAIVDNSGAETGYLIVGEEIYGNPTKSGLLMIKVSKDGDIVKSTTKTYDSAKIGIQVQGMAVASSKTSGNFFVLGKNLSDSEDMFYSEFDATTLNTKWIRTYGDAVTSLANRIYLYGDSIIWGGTWTASSKSLMRWDKAYVNTSPSSNRTYPSGPTTQNFTCNDICQFGFGYGMVGSYGTGTGYNRIAFFRLDAYGNVADSATYALRPNIVNPSFVQNDQTGNSITSTNDGGFLLLGTVAVDNARSDLNYYLIKTDAHGQLQWTKEYGGRYFDVGCRVIQASDGGYIVLGTTNLANLQSIFLMKTDSQGEIQ